MSELSITVKVTMIRDGTHGISMCAHRKGDNDIMCEPDKILGEWQDSGAVTLAVTDENAVSIRGRDNKHRYLVTLPGEPVKGELVSDTEAVVTIKM